MYTQQLMYLYDIIAAATTFSFKHYILYNYYKLYLRKKLFHLPRRVKTIMKGKSAVEFVTLMLSLLFSDARCSVEMRQVVLPNDNWSYNYSMSCINESTSCQPWSVCNASLDVCKCFQLSGDSLICNEIAQNKLIPSILDCNCVTIDEDNERQMVEVGKCIYNCARDQNNPNLIYQQLPDNMSVWNNFMCGEFHRTGSLCGKCDTDRDYYPRVYSFDMSCMKCDNSSFNWWKYILLAYVPLTVFYLIVFFFKVDIHSSQLQGFIIYSQYLTTPPSMRILLLSTRHKPVIFELVKLLGALYGIWNLDFFRTYDSGICFKMSSLEVLSLDLAVAVYPLFLIIFSYFLVTLHDQNFKLLTFICKPFKMLFSKWQSNFAIKTSTVNAFAAFFYLSNIKFFSICFDILTPVKVYQFYSPLQVNSSWRLYYDPTIKYFSKEHRWYALIALVIAFVFIIIPLLVLFLYSTRVFHKFLSILPQRWQLFLHVFVDSIQGCYKDGTEPGTRDCRWYVPMLYILRFLIMFIYGLTLNAAFFPYGVMMITIFVVMTILIDPFKSSLKYLSSSILIFILLIGSFFVSNIGAIMADEESNTITSYMFYLLTVTMSSLPLIYVAIIAIHWISSHLCLRNKIRELVSGLVI